MNYFKNIIIVIIWRLSAFIVLLFLFHVHRKITSVGTDVGTQAYFTWETTIIALLTGIKIFRWLVTIYGTHITYRAACSWALGFVFRFTVWGLTSVIQTHHLTLYYMTVFSITLPLRLINRSSPHNHRRVYSLIPTINWSYYKPEMIKGSICGNVYRSKYSILPTTFLRLAWIPWWYLDYPDAYTTRNIISSIGSTVSFVRVTVFLFIIRERIALNQ